MTQKLRKTLIMVVMAALIICLMAASLTYTFTYGRYAGGKFDNENSPYGDLIEFVGANQYIVRTPEELIQAIEDGYSNIKIADDAEEPFVIDTGVTDVSANLVLDVNGKTLIRNSRNPMLDVQTNVSVVLIYDSSDEEQGGFYNPVGSALQASGGTLTVGSGNYDDGPKKEEYNEYNGINSNHGTLDTSNSSVTLYARDNAILEDTVGYSVLSAGSRADTKGYGLVNGAQLPKINTRTVPGQNGAQDIVYGNIYLDNGSTLNTNWLPVDTFLLYTIEKDCFVEGNTLYTNAESQTAEDGTEQTVVTGEALTVACDVASCDFYYYYSIGDDDGDGYENYAVIYGYWDVKALARDDLPEGQTQGDGMATALKDSGLIYPYGAVRMVEGEGFARGGQFSNNFGTVNSYGIYANGGALTASGANFTTGGDGVCIRCEGSASLSIGGGTYSSAIGNTIEMSGGTMNVTAGKFTKNASSADTNSTNNGSAIDIQGGTLTMTGSDDKTFTITGSHVNGIKSSGGGTVTAEHTTFSMSGGDAATGTEDGKTYGTDMFGINIDSGTVTANGCDITIYGTYSAGILSMGKNVDDSTVSVGAAYGKASEIKASEIKVYVPENKKLLSSAGISSEGGKIQLTGNVNIETNGLGITARGPIDITGGEATVTTTHGTGIYVSGATITNTATLTVKSNITSGWSWVKRPENPEEDVNTNVNNGIYVENGSIDASAGTLNVTHTGVAGDEPDNNSTTGAATKSYAVFVKGDAEGGSQKTTVSIGKGLITGTSAGGVYVVGTSKQEGDQTTYTATVTLGGVEVTAQNTYAAGILTETGNVIINGNAHITSSALGIAVINGNVGISTDSTDSSVKATRATGVYVRGGTLYNQGTLSVESDLADENNNNLFYQHTGADISTPSTDPNPYNGVFVNGGSLVSNGTLNVTFTGVAADPEVTTSFPTDVQTKSYAVYVDTEADASASDTVTVAGGTINAGQAGGVYVEGGSVALGGSSTVTINTGAWTATDENQTINSSHGTYASAVYAHGGSVTMNGTVYINSAALGIVAVGVVNTDGSTAAGAVTIESGTTTIKAYRSTGVYIRGGSLTNDGTLDVTSTIKNSTGGTANTAAEAYKWAGADIEDDLNNSNIYNGVFVNGGSLDSKGTLNVTFTGVQNDAYGSGDNRGLTADTAYRDFQIKSYAVRVEGTDETTVMITSGKITNDVGGGVLVNGGTVTLGNSSNNSGPTVRTTGTVSYSTSMDPDGGNWNYFLPQTGGPAVKVAQSGSVSSTLTVYGGTYTAQQGDGIVTVGGTSYIHNGTFIGRDYNANSGERAGPGASYSFKVYGGTANVYGGTFGGQENDKYINSSGAFVMGTSANSMGTANIYGGSFVVSEVLLDNADNGGQAGFSVYEYGNVLVAPKGGENGTGTDVTMTGLAAGLVIEGNTSNTVSVEIKGGEFSSTRNHGHSDGIWYSNSNATLTISGGTFTGYARSGLYFETTPSGSKVQLSGGTYRGGENAWFGNSPGDITTGEILTDNAWLYDSGNKPIVYAFRNWRLNWTYSHVGGIGTSVALNGNLEVYETVNRSRDPLSNYKYITITAKHVTDSNDLENAANNRNFG